MNNKGNVRYLTFGCKLNFAETASLADVMTANGFTTIADGDTETAPDIVVVNTCSVTELADKKCRQAIRSIARRHPDAAILVTGCYAQLKPDEASKLPGVVAIAGSDRKDRIIEYATDWTERRERHVDVIDFREMRRFVPSCSRGDRTRCFLKIQDGCDYFCTYCTIPFARGRSRSATIADITSQAQAAADGGAKEIIITGVNIGDFGKPNGEKFIDLIRSLDKVDGIERYRISSIEPNLLTDEIIDTVAASAHFMPHFHIPLQAGNDEVLRLMRRHYDTALFARRIERIRQVIPDAFIGVDVIAGARGETPELFEQGIAFINSLDVTRLHVFPYSERPGTRALEISHVVSQEEKHERVRRLMEVSKEKYCRFVNSFSGTTRPVLVEHTAHGDLMHGFTDNYIKVALPYDGSLANTITDVRISGAVTEEDGALEGTVAQS